MKSATSAAEKVASHPDYNRTRSDGFIASQHLTGTADGHILSSRGYLMSYGRACALSTLAAVIAMAIPAGAQSVISTHSGLIHFFDGAVYLDDRPLESHLGRFPSLPQGGGLRTVEGRAEVLLTPGVFLRLGERSAIRMVSNDLADTQVELEAGSAIVDAGEPNPDTSITLIYKDWRVHFLRKGVYRIDSDPPCLLVSQGEAEVIADTTGLPVSVGQGMSLPLEGVLAPELSSAVPGDGLSNWAKGRGDSISADNAILAQIDEDPDSRTSGLDGVTYFPFLGVMPSLGLSSPGLYGSLTPYQTGFSSIYLPGYAYAPLIIGIMGQGLTGQRGGVRTYLPLPPRPIVVSTGGGSVLRVPPAPVPRAPVVTRPAPVAAPRVGAHVGGHK